MIRFPKLVFPVVWHYKKSLEKSKVQLICKRWGIQLFYSGNWNNFKNAFSAKIEYFSYYQNTMTLCCNMLTCLGSRWHQSKRLEYSWGLNTPPSRYYTGNLGQNKWKIKNTPPPISVMDKTVRFGCSASSSLIRRDSGFISYFILSKIVVGI